MVSLLGTTLFITAMHSQIIDHPDIYIKILKDCKQRFYTRDINLVGIVINCVYTHRNEIGIFAISGLTLVSGMYIPFNSIQRNIQVHAQNAVYSATYVLGH